MQVEEFAARHADAAEQFDERERRGNGRSVAHGLTHGFNVLRSQFFRRIHDDVQTTYGSDSMVGPVSILKADSRVNAEIEVYAIAESTVVVRQRHYVRDVDWYAEWLGRLRLGASFDQPAMRDRLNRYLHLGEVERELAFSNHLVKALREANRAPLVLYRLFPHAVGVITSVAFADHLGANEFRLSQIRILPSIEDCRECFGRVLENGDRCLACGNPVWKYAWLQASD